MNELLSSVMTGFVSTLTMLNISASTNGGVVPDVSVESIFMNSKDLVNTYPDAFIPSNTDINSFRDFIQDGAAATVLKNYQASKNKYQFYINNAAFSSAGASSYHGLLFANIDITGETNNAMGRTFEHTYEVGNYQAVQYPIDPIIGGDVVSTSNLTAVLNSSTEGKPYQKTGTITVNGNDYDFVSGISKEHPHLPIGEYSIRRHLNARSDDSFTKGGIGFSFVIEDAQRRGSDKMYDIQLGRERNYLRIHPDGGKYGTQGSIGLTGSSSTLKQFQEDLFVELKGLQHVLLTITDGSSGQQEQNNDVPGVNTNICFNPGAFTFNQEARLGNNEEIRVILTPLENGVTSFNIAGIVDTEFPNTFQRIESLVRSGKNEQAKAEVIRFYNDRSKSFVDLTQNPGLKLQFIDTIHLRGEGGLGAIVRRSIGGSFNMSEGRCNTLRPAESDIAALNQNPDSLNAFHLARQEYEWTCVDRGRPSREPFRQRLQKRFDDAFKASQYVSETCPSY